MRGGVIMKRKSLMFVSIFFFIFISFLNLLCSQTIRDFRLTTWGMFPWVYPNDKEKGYLEQINANLINTWLMNPQIDEIEYQNYYGSDYHYDDIKCIERAWMDYLNSTNKIGMYIGYNGFRNLAQFLSQIEAYAKVTNGSNNDFENVFNDYYNTFGNDPALRGYYVSSEDINDSANFDRIIYMLNYIYDNDPDHTHYRVIEHWNLGADNWVANNLDKFDIFERTFYVF